MADVTVRIDTLPGTEAAAGRAGRHVLVVDRPEGRAGGLGLGFNGAELLALAIGGCLANDLRYAAHADGHSLERVQVEVTLALDGEPIRATGASVSVRCDPPLPDAHLARIAAASMVADALTRGLPVAVRSAGEGSTA